MEKLFKYGALAVFLGTAGIAQADVAETKGGITIKTEDGRFEAKVGGRIHLDFVSLDNDESDTYSTEGGSYFRRARITLSGKAYGWEYKFENDFADSDDSGGGANSFRDMFIATKLGPGKFTLGQFKPLRGMEELTSSNEITMIERPFASASGMFSGRQFAIGGKFEGSGDNYTYGLAVQNNSVLKAADSRTTEEPVVTARVTFTPVMSDTTVLHLGLSGGIENGDAATGARFRGRGKLPATDLGTSRTLAEAGAATLAEDKDAEHIGFELAGKSGPFYAQSEYIMASYSDADDDGDGNPEDQDVDSYYVMASWLVTGESKPYRGGAFRSPKPKNSFGAVELKTRYDFAENKDVDDAEISVLTVGANWYVNPNVRFMLEYSMGEDKTTTNADGDDAEPTAVTLRAQMSF